MVLLTLLVIFYAITLRYMIETRPTIGAVYLNPLRGHFKEGHTDTTHLVLDNDNTRRRHILGQSIGSIKGVMPIHVGALFLGATLVVGLGSVFFGYVSDKLGRLRTMSIGIAGVSIGLIILTVLLLIGINPIIAVATSAPFIFMASAVVPSILALTGDEALVSMRGALQWAYTA